MSYRIHPAGESIETCKQVDRPIGWAMGGEEEGSGVACCSSLGALATYMLQYSMDVRDEDTLVEMDGYQTREGDDGPDHFMVATEVRAIGTGAEFVAAAELATYLYDESLTLSDLDDEEIVEDLECDAELALQALAEARNYYGRLEATTSNVAYLASLMLGDWG